MVTSPILCEWRVRMSPTRATVTYTADSLIEQYGARARQRVVDEIVLAVRDHDIETAKLWDEIGQLVDARLKVPAGQLSFL